MDAAQVKTSPSLHEIDQLLSKNRQQAQRNGNNAKTIAYGCTYDLSRNELAKQDENMHHLKQTMHRNPSFNPNEQDANRIVARSTSIPTTRHDITTTDLSPSVLKFELPISP